MATGCASDGSEMITSRSPSTQSWREIKNVTVFFELFLGCPEKVVKSVGWGEGADRPGERSHGLGCEVQIEKNHFRKKTS